MKLIRNQLERGVGMAMNPPQWLREGDVVEIAIDVLGAQRRRVTRATADLR